jgi:hypothetical protein
MTTLNGGKQYVLGVTLMRVPHSGVLFVIASVVGFHTILFCPAFAAAQDNLHDVRLRTATINTAAQAEGNLSQVCAARFTAFVRELDNLLANGPRTVIPIQDLFGKYLPVESCDVDEVLDIARRSRFFDSISDQRTYHAVGFNSRGVRSRSGFAVQVGFVKATGASRLPFVKVNGY